MMMSSNILQELNPLFYPQSIAVVGASPKDDPLMMNQGNSYIKGSISLNYKGKIYPVHPKAENTMGFTSYARVRDIPGDVDLVIFTIPAKAVLEVMEDCIEKKVKFVHFFTAGFSETGREEYAQMEKKIVHMARENGIRIVGPNCMGIYCPEGGLSFQPFLPTQSGSVGFFSQSGQMAGFFSMMGSEQGLAYSKVISFGNSSDLKASDFLSYLGQDEKTSVIGSYLEGVKDGRAFFETAREVTREKPLVIFKGGMTEGGTRAVKSHTAAIAGSSKIWRSLCKQAGIISVGSLDEMVYTLTALQHLALPRGKKVAIMGGAGGGSVTMTDRAELEGLKVPMLSEKTIMSLEKIIPPQGTSVKNPLDVGRTAMMGENLPYLIELLRDDPMVDALIFSQPLGPLYQFTGRQGINFLLDMTLGARDKLEKPLLIVLEKENGFVPDNIVKEAEERYHEKKVATFPNFQMAAKVMCNLADYQTYLSSGK